MVKRGPGAVVGTRAKGPPGPNRTVEIAYGINPEYQGRGYATEVARAFVAFAFGSGRVSARLRSHEAGGERVYACPHEVRVRIHR